MEFSVIISVDMFFGSGITPLATAGQTRIKIRLSKYIDTAQHESESMTTLPQGGNDNSVGFSDGQPPQNYARLSFPNE